MIYILLSVINSVVFSGFCLAMETKSALETEPIIVKSKTIIKCKSLTEDQYEALIQIDRASFSTLMTRVLAHINEIKPGAKGRFDICQFCLQNEHSDPQGLITAWALETGLNAKFLEGLCFCNIFFHPDSARINWTVFFTEVPEHSHLKELEKPAIEKLLNNLHHSRNLARYGLESVRQEILKLIDICHQSDHKRFESVIKAWAATNKKNYKPEWCLCSLLVSNSQHLHLSASFRPGSDSRCACCDDCRSCCSKKCGRCSQAWKDYCVIL